MRLAIVAFALGMLLIGCAASLSSARRVASFADVGPFLGPPRITVPADAIRVAPGDDAVDIVQRSPAGSTFVFEAGTHRLERPIVPRSGDAFIGEAGAVLSGARTVAPDGRAGELWYLDGLGLDTNAHGSCRSDRPRCNVRHDLFLDDVALRHVATTAEVTAGTWTLDTETGRVYLADDPAGRRLEVSVATGAIVGDANDVLVANFVVERFANPAQRGALMAERVGATTTFGERWTITGNEVRWNHGVGIRAGGGSWIVANHVHHNGQLGVASVGPGPTRVEANEIAFNNVAGYADSWEAGGTKFVRTDGLVLRHNHVHGNDGPGLWTDIDNVYTLIEHNLVEHNTGTGIFHEISYDAVIRHNEVRFNGLDIGTERYAYAFGAGILVKNSSNVSVYGNRVVGNWNGIVGLQQERGGGVLGRYLLRNLSVFDNAIWLPYHGNGVGPTGQRGVAALTGILQGGGFPEVFGRSYDNRFFANQYTVADPQRRHFAWGNTYLAFDAWQRCDAPNANWDGCRQDVDSVIARDAAAQDLPGR